MKEPKIRYLKARKEKPISDNQGNIVIYQTEDGNTRLEVKMEDDTLWLSQAQIATLFAVDRTVVTKHLGNIFEEGELDKDSVCAKFAHTAEDGKTYQTQFYNLDAIISAGYRIKSAIATHFRRWATERPKEYIIRRKRWEITTKNTGSDSLKTSAYRLI